MYFNRIDYLFYLGVIKFEKFQLINFDDGYLGDQSTDFYVFENVKLKDLGPVCNVVVPIGTGRHLLPPPLPPVMKTVSKFVLKIKFL